MFHVNQARIDSRENGPTIMAGLAHWNLEFDPFTPGRSPYVATPGHEAAVRRLVEVVERREPRAILVADAGIGKSMVVAEALTRLRCVTRRIAKVVAPMDGPMMLGALATHLGVANRQDASRRAAWRAFSDAVQLCDAQNLSIVVVVEDAHWLDQRSDLERIATVASHGRGQLTVVESSRPGADIPCGADLPCGLVVGLVPLTRTEADGYLRAKLAAAGRFEALFTPRAVARLHALGRGFPGRIDTLASRALALGATARREMIGADLIDSLCEDHELEVVPFG